MWKSFYMALSLVLASSLWASNPPPDPSQPVLVTHMICNPDGTVTPHQVGPIVASADLATQKILSFLFDAGHLRSAHNLGRTCMRFRALAERLFNPKLKTKIKEMCGNEAEIITHHWKAMDVVPWALLHWGLKQGWYTEVLKNEPGTNTSMRYYQVKTFVLKNGNDRSLIMESFSLALPPPILWTLTQLQTLSLEKNLLTFLPEWISNLKHLTCLSLAGNHLTSLPSGIGELIHLTGLYLQGNHLTSLPKTIGRLKALHWLCLEDNLLTSLPDGLWELSQLRTLSLEKNFLKVLHEDIGNLKYLTYISCCNNPFTLLPSTCGTLINLNELCLSPQQESDPQTQSVLQTLKINQTACRRKQVTMHRHHLF